MVTYFPWLLYIPKHLADRNWCQDNLCKQICIWDVFWPLSMSWQYFWHDFYHYPETGSLYRHIKTIPSWFWTIFDDCVFCRKTLNYWKSGYHATMLTLLCHKTMLTWARFILQLYLYYCPGSTYVILWKRWMKKHLRNSEYKIIWPWENLENLRRKTWFSIK